MGAYDEELIQKVCQAAHITPEEAAAALEAVGGDALEALAMLAREGKIPRDTVGDYSTSSDQEPAAQTPVVVETRAEKDGFWATCRRWLVDNRFEAYHPKSGREIQVPVGVAVILLLLSFWFVAVLLGVGYVLGWRYRFAGPDLSREEVNHVMENINDTAGDVVHTVRDGLSGGRNKRS